MIVGEGVDDILKKHGALPPAVMSERVLSSVVSQMSQLVSVWTKSESVCVPNMMRINFKCCISVRISPHG